MDSNLVKRKTIE